MTFTAECVAREERTRRRTGVMVEGPARVRLEQGLLRCRALAGVAARHLVTRLAVVGRMLQQSAAQVVEVYPYIGPALVIVGSLTLLTGVLLLVLREGGGPLWPAVLGLLQVTTGLLAGTALRQQLRQQPLA